jgi:hypothetical protein
VKLESIEQTHWKQEKTLQAKCKGNLGDSRDGADAIYLIVSARGAGGRGADGSPEEDLGNVRSLRKRGSWESPPKNRLWCRHFRK